MIVKCFEVRDGDESFFVAAVKMVPHNEAEVRLVKRAGVTEEKGDDSEPVLLFQIESLTDVRSIRENKIGIELEMFIEEQFDFLQSGKILDMDSEIGHLELGK